MPVPLMLGCGLSGAAASCWAGFTALYYSRRSVWKETGAKLTSAEPLPLGKKISVIVPAYNEEGNIADCARAILDSAPERGAGDLQLIVVDDMSKDGTLQEIERLKEEHPKGELLTIMSAGPRPQGEVWLGKCWAVWQGAQRAEGDWLVFVDADVRLKPGGLERAVSVAVEEDCDLLSGDVAFRCACFAEQLVQPIVLQNLVLNNDHASVNAPVEESDMASAAGHIMIFKRSSYEAFGGHSNENIRENVVEDVMLATFVKNGCGGTVRFYDFTTVAEIQMYDSFGDLVEGYSKNIYLAHGESAASVIGVSLLNLAAFALPAALFIWGGAALVPVVAKAAAGGGAVAAKTGAAAKGAAAAGAKGAAAKGAAGGAAGAGGVSGAEVALPCVLLGSSTACFGAQWNIRRQLDTDGRISSEFWWTQPAGGLLLITIAYMSLFKGVTGLGWTWKGRPLDPEAAMACAKDEADAAGLPQSAPGTARGPGGEPPVQAPEAEAEERPLADGAGDE